VRNIYRIVRFLFVSLLSLTVGIPILLYILLSIGGVHEHLRQTAEKELGELLGANVGIDKLRILPFSRLELERISVDCAGDTLLQADVLNAGISLRNLLLRGRIVITDVEIMGPYVNLWRTTPQSPLNAQPIIDRLKGNGEKKQSQFNISVHTVVVRAGRLAYNVISEPDRIEFDPNHISINELRADITAPRICNDNIVVSLKRLNFSEKSGLVLRNMSVDIEYTPDCIEVKGLRINLPHSQLTFADTKVNPAKETGHIADIIVKHDSHIAPGDLAALIPQLAALPTPFRFSCTAELFSDSLSLRSLKLESSEHLALTASATASRQSASIPGLDVRTRGEDIASIANAFHPLPTSTTKLLGQLGLISFSGSATWRKPDGVEAKGLLGSDIGSVEIDARLQSGRLSGVANANGLDLGTLLPDNQLGIVTLTADFDAAKTDGQADLFVDALEWRGHTFTDLSADIQFHDKTFNGVIALDDSLLQADVIANLNLTPGAYNAYVDADIAHLNLHGLGLSKKYENYTLGCNINADFNACELTRPTGTLEISDFNFRNNVGEGMRLATVELNADLQSPEQHITLGSDLIDADIHGQIGLKSLPAAVNNLLTEALPQYFTPHETDSLTVNDFEFKATIKETSPVFAFVKLPVTPLYPVNLSGMFNQHENSAAINLSAPYLRQGNKLIHAVSLSAMLGNETTLSAHADIPSKQGDMGLNLSASMTDGLGHLAADWKVDCPEDYSGKIGLTVCPMQHGADINILPGELVFNNATWDIEPAFIGIRNGAAVVHDVNITRPGQEATISGVVSADIADHLSVKLNNIDLDYVFDTLELGPALMFGGTATGTVHGSGLLGSEAVLQTNDLYVHNFSYGGCVMGNAHIKSNWNNETRGVEIHANVPGPVANGVTVVDGVIFPMSEELEFTFKATHSPVGFLRPLMSTFASDVDGTASGWCHLFGNFKNVDLEGEMRAENFAMSIGFTGVTYFAEDSIHIRPGIIEIPGITLRDASGHTALFQGELRHKYFKNSSFDFRVSNARSLLVYDMPATAETPWYGKVRGTGSVNISGIPGYVKISAAMATAPGTDFAFSLNDSEQAAEYNFLTFRDATPADTTDSVSPVPGSPELDKIMLAKLARQQERALTSNYDFDFQIDVTPEAKMTLVMDPTAGDKITAFGSGHVGILYGSGNDDLRMYGDYRIARGDYNFSLQDIILKNFSIRDGSEVSFYGDPLDANLNIAAIYQLNANLSDLDESFLNDKEVQRTNVPVYAVLNVNGSIQDPQISFDIDFPTLSSDVKRKVASIVSTDEMMNRQIIYLLALNRFYTPDYMTATKGNELVSVASGTISSQLSNILGQLSDKISVAPSVRSDAGDFSDVEFDVALSSTLLNNRLLLNGNFGYRDKALNNNQFIGDFDIEYLLSRTGNWRLKAYNHFNDRNFYVKTALTTQGIGIVFKHDFDNLFRRK